MYRTHTNNDLNATHLDQEVTLCGWVHRRRDHGGVIFVDLRDRYGLTQIVTDPELFAEAHQKADQVRPEFVIKATGKVRRRPEGQENSNMDTGEIEVLISELEVLNKAATPPFEIDQETDVNEELRLQYRYLDLRRERMQRNIIMRHKMAMEMRKFFDQENFLEIETPILIKGTPEGAREYIVPSRLYPGKFFVLPQSPQQLKQLLMIAGYDRYFQLARCMRDEDQRGDRQPEFTQLDLEMAFVDQEDVLELFERMLIEMSEKLVPHKKIIQKPFPRITWVQAMNDYGIDKPDIRYDLKIKDVSDLVQNCEFSVFSNAIKSGGVVRALKVDGGLELTRKEIDDLTELAKIHGAKGLAYLQITDEGPKSNIQKYFSEDELKAIVERTEAKAGDIIFFGADSFNTVCAALAHVRIACAKRFNLIDKDKLGFCWIVDFPLFEKDPVSGELAAVHHPFTHPKKDQVEMLNDPEKLDKIFADCYDAVLNGYELGSGSIRIFEPELQSKVFEVLGITPEDATMRFGHMMEAFKYGAPPHAGFAMGIERIAMIYLDEENIREVMAFPKDQKAKDLMLGAPSEIPEKRLEEANIEIKKQD